MGEFLRCSFTDSLPDWCVLIDSLAIDEKGNRVDRRLDNQRAGINHRRSMFASPLETAKAKFAILRAWTALPAVMNRGLSL
jgi:hypothetical protein